MNGMPYQGLDGAQSQTEEARMEDIQVQLERAADLLQKSVFDLAGRIAPSDVSQLVLAAATAERIAGRLAPDKDPDTDGTKT